MSLDRRAALAAMAGALAAPAYAAAPHRAAGRKPSIWAPADAAARKIVEGRLSPGVSILVRKHGRTIYDGSSGLADIETGTPMTSRSICRVGSITKQFTAAAILLLAEEGKLSLNDALSVYIPDFPRAKDLPLRRMLSHTAGLGNYTEGPPGQFVKEIRPDRTTAELVAWMASTPRLQISEPGTAWRYSNTAYVLLGAVIERVADKPYSQVLAERIFKPLGLSDTAYDRNSDVVPRRAAGYSIDVKAPSGFDNAAYISMTVPGAAGALRSTVSDLCAWHEALFGGKVLKPEMLTEMTTPAVLNNGKLPEGPGPGGKPVTIRYGFGLATGEEAGHKTIGHDGGIPGFGTHLTTFPDDAITLAIIQNSDGGPGPGVAPDVAKAPADLRNALRTAALAG